MAGYDELDAGRHDLGKHAILQQEDCGYIKLNSSK